MVERTLNSQNGIRFAKCTQMFSVYATGDKFVCWFGGNENVYKLSSF